MSGTVAPPGALTARSRSARGRRAHVAEQHEHGLLAGTLHLDVAAPGGRALEPRPDARVDVGVLEVVEQLGDLLGVVLDRREPHRPAGPLGGAQAGGGGEHAGDGGVASGDQNPVLAAAVAAELDVVAGVRGAVRGAAGVRARGATVAGSPTRLLGVGEQRAAREVAEAHARALLVESVEQLGGVVVDRHERAADLGHLARVRVFEQRGHGLGRGVGGEAEPPVAVGARDVEQQLAALAFGAAARDGAVELGAYFGRVGQPVEQQRERLRLVGLQRNAPRAFDGVPAAAGDRAQQHPQTVVVGKTQHGLVAREGGGDGHVGHGPPTIGAHGDA